jgi:uncharacterized protein (DUF924 family)
MEQQQQQQQQQQQMQEVLDFWFLPAGSQGHGEQRGVWFRKDAQFDAAIRTRFGALIEQAVAGGLRDWDDAGAEGRLARILLLDQFTRNVWRDTPQAFGGDALALAAAQEMLDAGDDLTLAPLARAFAYLPFEHAEDLALQQQSVALFEQLNVRFGALAPTLAGMRDYAIRHRDVIARFGRFPHRNAILGRSSTPEEQAYLREPGSGF